MAVTMNEVAEHANVSQKTVSNVIHNYPFVNENIRKRVLNSIQELGYIPNDAAQKLRYGNLKAANQKTCNIGCVLFIPDFDKFQNPFFNSILKGIDLEAIKQKYQMLFIYTADQLDSNPALYNRFTPETIDGVITVCGISSPMEERVLKNILSRTNCVVSIDSPGIKNIDNFDIDKERAAYEAVEYLVKLGHKRIGFAGDHTEPRDRRFDGYRRALSAFGIEYDESLVEGDFWKYGVQHGYNYMQRIMERANPLPTAVFASSDANAIGAMNAIRAKGLKVPDDISVIGFDDIEEAKNTYPPLTTMRVRKEDLGSLAFNKLAERSRNPDLPAMRMTLSAELVIRQSCASPKA